jgi:hypothetical protein
METIKISEDQNTVTIGSNVHEFNRHGFCIDCDFLGSDYCQKAPCRLNERKDRKSGNFKLKYNGKEKRKR